MVSCQHPRFQAQEWHLHSCHTLLSSQLLPTAHLLQVHHPLRGPSRVRLFATPWTVALQAPLSMGFSRRKSWSGLPFPSPGDLPDPGIKLRSPTLLVDSVLSEPPRKPLWRSRGWILCVWLGSDVPYPHTPSPATFPCSPVTSGPASCTLSPTLAFGA